MRVFVGLAVCVLVLSACGGKTTDDADLVIADSQGALAGPDPSGTSSSSTAGEEDDGDRADDGCRDGDHDGHKHHRKHWFKVLDLLDGTKDKQITIGSLPAGLPAGLLAKLAKLDRNGDGIVTRAEVKRHRHHKNDGDHDGEDREQEQERDGD